jgi:hypothetical protein
MLGLAGNLLALLAAAEAAGSPAGFHAMKRRFYRRIQTGKGLVRQRRTVGSEGPWEFTSSGRLFCIGARDDARRTAYRGADGTIRFFEQP